MAHFASIPSKELCKQASKRANLDLQSLLMTGNRTLLYTDPNHRTVLPVTVALPCGARAPAWTLPTQFACRRVCEATSSPPWHHCCKVVAHGVWRCTIRCGSSRVEAPCCWHKGKVEATSLSAVQARSRWHKASYCMIYPWLMTS